MKLVWTSIETVLITILQNSALPIQCTYIFGLVVKNTAKPSSDVDLAILYDELDVQEKLRLLDTIVGLTGLAVDCVDFKSAGMVVALEALNSNRLIGTDE